MTWVGFLGVRPSSMMFRLASDADEGKPDLLQDLVIWRECQKASEQSAFYDDHPHRTGP
jgi:hypothetical protein